MVVVDLLKLIHYKANVAFSFLKMLDHADCILCNAVELTKNRVLWV